ncbi:MAG: hypothetical protein KDI01_08625 [Halioglobus sp.]|nr:hypothetical protein [Halioglobus sp.]
MSIQFELCHDSQLLSQYYDLRERCFRQELDLPGFDGREEDRDRQGSIVVARSGQRCVGGVRIAPSTALEERLGELGLVPELCCMWERFVFDPAVRVIPLMRQFCAYLVEMSRQFGYHHALVLSSLRNARFYRACHSALGVDFQIHQSVPDCAEGAFEGLEHYLSVSYLADDTFCQAAA